MGEKGPEDPSIYEQPGNFVQQQTELNKIQGEQVPGAPLPRELERKQQQDIASIAQTQKEMLDRQARSDEIQAQELKTLGEIRKEISEMREEREEAA